MTEIIFTKRRGKEGELGLFVDTVVFEEEWSSLKIGEQVKAECTVPANLKYQRFFFAMVKKVAENSPDDFLDSEHCRERILIAARHCKYVDDRLRGRAEIKAKSVAGLSGDAWIRLLRRVNHVVTTEFLPGMDENELKAEIEKMLEMNVHAQDSRSDAPAPPQEASVPRKGGQDTAGAAADLEKKRPSPDRPGPQNEAEYIAAARAWLRGQTDRFKALNYFEGDTHKEMRQRLGVSPGVLKMLHREIQEFFNTKEKT